jgi:hypothetical protein
MENERARVNLSTRESQGERTAQTTHTPWSARGCPPENPATEMLRLAALCFLLLLAAPLMQARSRAGAIGRAPRARAAAGTKGSFTPSRCAALGATCRWLGASAPHRGPTAAATASQPPPRGSHPQPFHPLPSPPLRPAPCFRCLTRTRAAPSRPAQSIGAAPRRAAFRTTGKCPGRGSRARRALKDARGSVFVAPSMVGLSMAAGEAAACFATEAAGEQDAQSHPATRSHTPRRAPPPPSPPRRVGHARPCPRVPLTPPLGSMERPDAPPPTAAVHVRPGTAGGVVWPSFVRPG